MFFTVGEESSGRASKGASKRIGGIGSLRSHSENATSEVAKTRQVCAHLEIYMVTPKNLPRHFGRSRVRY